jgi:hypothetical protein
MAVTDDAKFLTVLQDHSTASAELQNCLDAICEWSNEWQLKLARAMRIA